jgi:hypothetical protein
LAFKQRSGFAFEPIADFDQTAVEERQVLYQTVAETIWSVDRLAAAAEPDVGSQLRWRIAIHLHATLQNSHQNGGRVFSSSWRIREPYGRAGKTARRLCDETGALSSRLLPTEPICCPDGRTGRLRKIGEDSDSAATLRFSSLASRRACLFIGE